MIAFDLAELQGAGDRVEDVVGDAADVALLQVDVPVGADTGEHGDFFAAQPGYAPPAGVREPDPLGGELGAAGGEEVPDLGAVVHGLHATSVWTEREVELVPSLTQPPAPARAAVSWMT
jgi:hypothetical protein